MARNINPAPSTGSGGFRGVVGQKRARLTCMAPTVVRLRGGVRGGGASPVAPSVAAPWVVVDDRCVPTRSAAACAGRRTTERLRRTGARRSAARRDVRRADTGTSGASCGCTVARSARGDGPARRSRASTRRLGTSASTTARAPTGAARRTSPGRPITDEVPGTTLRRRRADGLSGPRRGGGSGSSELVTRRRDAVVGHEPTSRGRGRRTCMFSPRRERGIPEGDTCCRRTGNVMGKVVASASMSLDGYIAKADNTIGHLFDWFDNGDVELRTINPDITLHLNQESFDYWQGWVSTLGALVCRADAVRLHRRVGRAAHDGRPGGRGHARRADGLDRRAPGRVVRVRDRRGRGRGGARPGDRR